MLIGYSVCRFKKGPELLGTETADFLISVNSIACRRRRRLVVCDCYRPHTKYDGKVIFSVCLSVHWGRGYPSLLVPGISGPRSFSGWGRGYPGLWSQVLSLVLANGKGVPQSRSLLGRGYPVLGPLPPPKVESKGPFALDDNVM